jgi:hypothetical protein
VAARDDTIAAERPAFSRLPLPSGSNVKALLRDFFGYLNATHNLINRPLGDS